MAELMTDGFTFTEASSIVVAPLFDADGGTESERAYIMSIIQKYNEIDDIKDIFNIDDEPTPVADMSTGNAEWSSGIFEEAEKEAFFLSKDSCICFNLSGRSSSFCFLKRKI